MQTRRKESRNEGCFYRNKKAMVLLDDPTLGVSFPQIYRIGNRRSQIAEVSHADAVSRTIFMIAFACVRFGGSTGTTRTTRPRRTLHFVVSSGRRVHNTDASIILEILPGIKRDARASSHAYVCPCTQTHTPEYRLSPLSRRKQLYTSEISSPREIFLSLDQVKVLQRRWTYLHRES